MRLAGVVAALALPTGSGAQAPGGYLNGATVVLQAPAPPAANSDTDLVDLYLVRIAQRDASPAALTEAYDDAAAYSYDDLLPRFSAAAGAPTPLGVTSRPMLAHMMALLLDDTMASSRAAKAGHPRTRPYAKIAGANRGAAAPMGEIMPCYTYRLEPTGSYPSGHAANGYAAALLLAAVFPARRAEILARGARYGDNRVICGVHHPIDVERGRALARAVFDRVSATPAFAEDLACAQREGTASASPACIARSAGYRTEMIRRVVSRACAAAAPGPAAAAPCLAPATP